MIKRLYVFLMTLSLLSTFFSTAVQAADYSDYSNEKIRFGLVLRDDHKRPECEKPSGIKLSDYNTWYYNKNAYKKDEKVIYLTFDCGYENGNTPSILDTLKAYDIKAIFFVTKTFVENNPKLVKRMKKEGHLVGNHTSTHPSLPDCSIKRIKKEMNDCKKAMKKKTGYDMDPYMRPPMGHYSVRVIKALDDMGYATMLWSLAIYDYEVDDQPGADYVVKKFRDHHFCGMMPLLHVISTSDTEALPDVIDAMYDKGYRFGTVDEFASAEAREAAAKAKEETAQATEAGQTTEAGQATEAEQTTEAGQATENSGTIKPGQSADEIVKEVTSKINMKKLIEDTLSRSVKAITANKS